MAEQQPQLGPRKGAVLRAVVEEYVRSGEPVGSETIAEHAGIGVSSATSRAMRCERSATPASAGVKSPS